MWRHTHPGTPPLVACGRKRKSREELGNKGEGGRRTKEGARGREWSWPRTGPLATLTETDRTPMKAADRENHHAAP
jgi:hypothetical protein